MGRDVNLEDTQVYPLRPSLFPNVPPYVKFIPVSGKNCPAQSSEFVVRRSLAGCYEFCVDPPEEMKEMLWMVPSAPWHTISSSAELNGFTICEVNTR